jgi:HlyD family secretion protein
MSDMTPNPPGPGLPAIAKPESSKALALPKAAPQSGRNPRAAIRRINLFGITVVLVAVGGVGGWATTTELAGAVIAGGNVVVESNVKKVQHPNGGIVGQILVQEGSEVEAGQLLVRLDDTLTRATLGVVQSQLDVYQAREARLSAERDGVDKIAFPESLLQRRSDPTVESSIVGEEKLFQSRREGRAGQVSQLKERVTQTKEEIRGLEAQQQSKESEIKFIGEELSGVSALYKQNLVTIVRYMQLQRDKARLEGERGQLIADIARSKGKIAETELQILQVDRDFLTDVLKDLRESQGKIAELQERVNAAQDELKRIDIRAPQAGIVYQLQVHTIGGVIGKGETLMQIVPKADKLIVEAKIPPQDIDQVGEGAPVHVRIMAGNRRMMPDLNGKVIVVSPDLTHDPQQSPQGPPTAPYYMVRVSLDAGQTKRLGDLKLLPGMPAEVYIRTHDRTPLDYLLKPLREQISRTFRER